MTTWKGWKAIIRDIVMFWIVTALGGFVVGVVSAAFYGNTGVPLGVIGLTNIVLGTICFCISGCWIVSNRWPHLALVMLGVWLTSFINLLLIPGTSVTTMVSGLVLLLIMMGIGGGISLLIVKPGSGSQGTIQV